MLSKPLAPFRRTFLIIESILMKTSVTSSTHLETSYGMRG